MRGGSRAIEVTCLTWMVMCVCCLLPVSVSAQVIGNLGVIPSPFSPDGDGILDQTNISVGLEVHVDSLQLVVRNDAQAQVWSLSVEDVDPGTRSWIWTGTTSAGSPFSDGVHVLTARAFIGGAVQDSVVRLVATDVSAPRIVDFRQIRSSFAPDADLWNLTGLRFGIEIGGPASDTTVVRVVDIGGSQLVSVGGFSGSVVETTFYWDGTDGQDAVFEEGSYSFEVTSADEAGNRDEQMALIYLDLGAPDVVASDSVIFAAAAPETVTGWALDPSGVQSVFVREIGGSWGDLEVAGGDTVPWAYVFGDTSTADGWYDVWLRGRDVFGHESDSVRVSVGLAGYAPVHVGSAIVAADTIFTNGEEIEIETRWDRAGYEIEADFSGVDSKYAAGQETVTDNGDSSYTIAYTIGASNTRENDEGIQITIRAIHVYRTDSAFVWVELRNEQGPGPPPDHVTLDQNVFNPVAGEFLTIEFPSSTGGTAVRIYNLAAEEVRAFDLNSETAVVWSGENTDGETVSSGVYLVRVQGDGYEVIRKVGVVK